MPEELTLEEYLKEDALVFDAISKAICNDEDTNHEHLLQECENFEKSMVLFKILPSYYVMKTILYFKLDDYENAHKYINGSLKYLLYVAKNAQNLSEIEQKNFDEYKNNVIDQYKILTQKKPEYLNVKSAVVPDTVKFITSSNEAMIEKEQMNRVLMRKTVG